MDTCIKEIGGYFQLEFRPTKHAMHANGLWFNTARNALEYILQNLPDLRCLWIPSFTCEAIMEPIHRLGVQYKTYSINKSLELSDEKPLSKGDYLLGTNYYGIKDSYMDHLFSIYGKQLIIDNAQAWFACAPLGAKAIYSPRKYAGVPDGGIAYCPSGYDISTLEQDISYPHCLHLLKRIDQGGSAAYDDFKANEEALSNRPLKRMSTLTEAIMRSIDFERIRYIRKENFHHLHKALMPSNLLHLPSADSYECPLVYPYSCPTANLREKLISHKIYTATYWPNILAEYPAGSLEYQLAKNTIAIPIDQRYNKEDMEKIISIIKTSK